MMRSIPVWFFALLLPLYATKEAPKKPPLGINLAGITDWSSEIVFVDAFKPARTWISQAKGKPWGKGGPLDVNERGEVRSLQEGQYAETVVWTNFGDRFPQGKFICLYSGEGDLDFTGDARVTRRAAGRLEVEVKAKSGAAFARITRTNPRDPLRKIRLIPEQSLKSYETEPFHPDFLARWKGFRVFRFMDWQATNHSKLVEWADRPTPEDHSQSRKGVALEYMIALSNAGNVEPWFCLPHRATDDHVRQFAKMVKEKLSPTLRIHVEYSNECWNGQFEQARYCAAEGKKLGLSKNAYEAQLRYYSRRSIEIFRIWEEVFGGRKRLIRVLAAQSVNPWTGATVLDWNDAYKRADAIAIAPYFGHSWGNPKTMEKVAAMDIEDLMKALEQDVARNRKHMDTYAALAKKRGLQLLAYEGGQHLAGYQGAENNDKLTALFHAANRHPKMKALYLADLKNWQDADGGLFCVYSSMGQYGKWGSWGVLEHAGQDVSKAPKMQALRECLAR